MKIFRSTVYFSPVENDCFSMVLRECDFAPGRSPEEELRATASTAPAGAFVFEEVFEMPGAPSVVEASVEAERRRRADALREANMAMLYYWDAGYLAKITDGGTLSATRPAPLSAEDVARVFEQLARHPAYRNHVVRAMAEDGRWVSLRNGAVERAN